MRYLCADRLSVRANPGSLPLPEDHPKQPGYQAIFAGKNSANRSS